MNSSLAGSILQNTYVIMRHGRSIANEEGVIISDPVRGVNGYGLSKSGREDVRASALRAKESGVLNADVIIRSSDFLRAKETAEITADILDATPIICTPRLRERFFGEWDGTRNGGYAKVWNDDVHNTTDESIGVESVESVRNRVMALVDELENTYTNKTILFVSHGDTLQILQTAFANTAPREHRSLAHLGTAQIRALWCDAGG